MLLTALSGVVSSLGYTGLFLVVAGESAGIPLPGETGLIAGGILASQGHLSLALVVATAAAAASVGGVAGYLIGRHAGRRLISRAGPFAELRLRFVERGEEFFARHGAASVFLARWAPGVRIVGAWLAGIHHMELRRFVLWNTLGSAGWATSVGVAAFFLGRAAGGAFAELGFAGLALALAVVLVAVVWHRRRR